MSQESEVDSNSLKYWLTRMNELTFTQKKPYGPPQYGKQISYIRLGEKRLCFQFGADPNPIGPDGKKIKPVEKDLVKTFYGVSVYTEKKEEDTMAPGIPMNSNQYVHPSFPQAGAQQQQQQQSSNDSSTKTRRTVDIHVPLDNEDFYTFCRLFDERVRQILEERCMEFFEVKKQLSADVLDEKYTGILSEFSKSGLRYLNGKVDTTRCAIRKALLTRKVQRSTADSVLKHSYITPCVEISGIIFNTQKKQVQAVNACVNIPSLLFYESPQQSICVVKNPTGYTDEEETEEESLKRKHEETTTSNNSKKQKQEQQNNSDEEDSDDDEFQQNIPGSATTMFSPGTQSSFP